ncbi:MAG: HNH endonuclease signature motif containing protein, partial [Armatimonadota bacterium]
FERECRLTHVGNPTHLIASHIKPWRESNNDERLAGGNGLLLTPSIDHLFDRGFITFGEYGWTADKPDYAKLPYDPIAMIRQLCPESTWAAK